MNKYIHYRIWLTSLLISIGIIFPQSIQADKIWEFPADPPAIEALINLHKTIKKDEDAALGRIGTSLAEQTLVSKGSKLFNDVRTTLDSKLNNVHSYVVLASAISMTANGLYRLTKEYKDFTMNTYKYVIKKPFVAWYYGNANYALIREIKHCQKLYAMFAASGVNIIRASMDQQLQLLMTLRTSIDKARSIIYDANLWCRIMVSGDWKPDYIWEILTADVTADIAKALIAKWNK